MASDLTPPNHNELRPVDRDLLMALRSVEVAGVGELTKILKVTATAVRQRVERLLELGLIQREKIVSGRGRPTFKYQLTQDGLRRTSVNATKLAEAMWQEIIALEDEQIRKDLISSVASRLGKQIASEISFNDASFEMKMQLLSQSMASSQMDTTVKTSSSLPVLDIGTCPYPSLTSVSDDREMCRMEERMISEALGQAVHLSSCRLDGDSCCQFSVGEQNQ